MKIESIHLLFLTLNGSSSTEKMNKRRGKYVIVPTSDQSLDEPRTQRSKLENSRFSEHIGQS